MSLSRLKRSRYRMREFCWCVKGVSPTGGALSAFLKMPSKRKRKSPLKRKGPMARTLPSSFLTRSSIGELCGGEDVAEVAAADLTDSAGWVSFVSLDRADKLSIIRR